jgi:GNAT superfamily N-acetyltransferase
MGNKMIAACLWLAVQLQVPAMMIRQLLLSLVAAPSKREWIRPNQNQTVILVRFGACQSVKNYRGHGIATKLMSASEDWARKHGCTKIGLWPINPIAANFYMKRMQYKKTEEHYFTDNWFRKLFVPPAAKYEKLL